MNITHYSKEIFVKDYFEIHNHYINIYKDNLNCKILILMQVGSFHECYNTDTEGPNLHLIGEKLDMMVTQKNKSKPLSTSNPRMMGFPSYIVDEVMEKIIMIGYTIIRIDQTSEPPNIKREIVGIYSPSTHITNNNNNINKNLICITIDGIKFKTTKPLLCIGIASYCMMTGEGCIYETISTQYDNMLALDGAVRFLEKYPPSEVVYYCSKNVLNYLSINTHINHMTLDDIMKYIGITNINMFKIKSDSFTNVKYQQDLIYKTFNDMMESINLHVYNMARLALVGILEFTTNHMPLLLDKLHKPNYFDQTNTMFLGNKAIEQLDIIPMTDKVQTLFSTICYTKTPMGKRLLKDNLCNPSILPEILNHRYNIIELLLESNIFDNIYNSMNNIIDMPASIRKMELNKIFPNEVVCLYNSLNSIKQTIIIPSKNIRKLLKINSNINNSINEIIQVIETTFNIEYMTNMNFINYKEETTNFITNGCSEYNYTRIKELEESIHMGNNFMDHLVKI